MLNKYALLASSSLILFMPLTVSAQSSISFRGTAPALTIPLNPDESVEFSAETGNLEASCLFQTGTTVCQGVGAIGSGQAPTVVLGVTGLQQDGQGRWLVAAGVPATVTRTITNSADVCIASTVTGPAAATGWDNLFAPAATSTANSVRFPSAGEYQIGLRCYNGAGAAATPTTLTFLVQAPVGPNPDSCSLPPHANINPTGFTRHVLTWNDLFGTGAFPGYTTRSPIGSFTIGRTLGGPLSAGMYITVPVTVAANTEYTLRHYPAQWVGTAPPGVSPGTWYPGDPNRAGAAFVSISPCAGDLRPWTSVTSDPILSRCRTDFPVTEGPFAFTTKANAGALCQLTAGQTYWLTYAMVNPNDGLTTTENTCAHGERCETTVEFSSR
jgi:hypothetical protein